MHRILVTDSLGREGLDFLAGQRDVQVDVRSGLSEDELAAVMGEYDALIVRSRTRVTAGVLSASGRLRVVARAGVGVDNIDLDAATGAGVLVINTPDANTVSTAELTMAHILALSRKLVPACVSTKGGAWERKAFQGSQLAGKMLGIVGFGRIGRALARRALAMEMRVLAYDPFYAGASTGEVAFCDTLESLLGQCDILTVHTPLTSESAGMIGAPQLAAAKRGLLVVNCARGGIIDEPALVEALRTGQVAGAGIDAFATEPPRGNALLEMENVVVTPHLGASTAEAQAGVAMEACEAVLAYLRNGEIRGAVNVGGVDLRLDEYGRRLADVSQRMGALLAKLSRGPLRRLKVTFAEERAQAAAMACARFMMVELLRPHLDQRVNVVNVMRVARQRDLVLEVIQAPDAHNHEAQIEAQVSSDVEHTVTAGVGYNGLPHVWQIDGYRMDMIPEGQMVMISNVDRPGVIGIVGTIFGDAGINVADMSIARQGARAMMVIRIDSPADDTLLARLRESETVRWVEAVALPRVERPARS